MKSQTSNPNQTQTSSQTQSKRETLAKKLTDIKQTVALPVIGNVTIPIDNIEDIQPVNVNGKMKLRIIFRTEDGEYKYTLLGMVFTDQVNECLRNGNTLEIVRDTSTLRTEVLCE
jgi:hypothetical protein